VYVLIPSGAGRTGKYLPLQPFSSSPWDARTATLPRAIALTSAAVDTPDEREAGLVEMDGEWGAVRRRAVALGVPHRTLGSGILVSLFDVVTTPRTGPDTAGCNKLK